MDHVQLDTGHLLTGLTAFQPGADVVADDSKLIEAIDLLCHLLCREKVHYDGAVYGRQAESLEAAREEVKKHLSVQARRCFYPRLEPSCLAQKDETRFVQSAVGKVSINALRISEERSGLCKQIRLSRQIPSSGRVCDSFKAVFIPALREKSPPSNIDAILTDRQIAGRRFMWAALKDENARRQLKYAVRSLAEGPACDVLQLLFAHFRAELALERNQQLAEALEVRSDQVFYAPTATRSALLAVALRPDEDEVSPLEAEDKIDAQIQSAWFNREEASRGNQPYLPLPLKYVLAHLPAGARRRVDLLGWALELSATNEASRLRRSLDALVRKYLGHHDQRTFLSELRRDACLVSPRRKPVIADNPSTEIPLLLSLAPAVGWIAKAGVAVTHVAWRFRRTRVHAAHIRNLLPPNLTEQDYVDRFSKVFGRPPPTVP